MILVAEIDRVGTRSVRRAEYSGRPDPCGGGGQKGKGSRIPDPYRVQKGQSGGRPDPYRVQKLLECRNRGEDRCAEYRSWQEARSAEAGGGTELQRV